MSTLKTGALRGTSGTADSVQLHASDQSVTFPGAVTVTGTLTNSGLPVAVKYAQFHDQKSAETNAGTFTSGAWRDRDITTEVIDADNIASLSSNQITLVAGTYRIEAFVPGFNVNRHKAKLVQVSGSSFSDVIGTADYSHTSAPNQTFSKIFANLTLGAETVFKIQHQCQSTKTDDGFGISNSYNFTDDTVEIYTVVRIWKIA